MKMNLSLLLVAFSGLLLLQANPSLRGLQQATTNVTAVNTTSSNNGTTTTNTTVVSNTTNTTGSSNATNTTGSSNSTNATNVTVVNPYAGYTQINVSDLSASWYNPQVFGAFRHGVNALVQTIIFQQRAPLAVYNVTQWVSAWYRNTSSRVVYLFQASLNNSRGVVINMNLTVNQNRRTGVNSLGGYNYRVLNIPRGSFPSEGYKFATPAQVHNNVTLQGALSFGAQWMIQSLVNANKIPATGLAYNMTGLSLAVYRTQANGTSYKFQTQNENANYVHVDTNYTVFYSNADKSYNVTKYWYRGYNYSDSELVNSTNVTNSTSNVTTPTNTNTSLSGNETTTVVDNSTIVQGSGDVVVVSTNTTNNTVVAPEPANTTNTTNGTVVAPEPTVAPPAVTPEPTVVPVVEPTPAVTVNITGVTGYVETETTTPLVNFNRPAQPEEASEVTESGAVSESLSDDASDSQ